MNKKNIFIIAKGLGRFYRVENIVKSAGHLTNKQRRSNDFLWSASTPLLEQYFRSSSEKLELPDLFLIDFEFHNAMNSLSFMEDIAVKKVPNIKNIPKIYILGEERFKELEKERHPISNLKKEQIFFWDSNQKIDFVREKLIKKIENALFLKNLSKIKD